jgi:TonB family protein
MDMKSSNRGILTALSLGALGFSNIGFAQWKSHSANQSPVPDVSCQNAIDVGVRIQKAARMRRLQGLEQNIPAELVLPFKEDGSIDQPAIRVKRSTGNPLLDTQLVALISTMPPIPACSHGPGPGPWETLVNWKIPSIPEIYRGNTNGSKPIKLLLVKQAVPAYPRDAIMRQIEGTTDIALFPAPDGSVAVAEVAQSSGSKILDNAALDAAYMSTFRPYQLEPGQKVPGVKMPFDFKLEESAPASPAVTPSR